jgi:hypothetical protein
MLSSWRQHVHALDPLTKVPPPACTLHVGTLTSDGASRGLSRVLAAMRIDDVQQSDLLEEGFSGWWTPTDQVVASFALNGIVVPIITTTPWDGGTDGRKGVILREAARAERAHLRDLLDSFDLMLPIIAEVKSNWTDYITEQHSLSGLGGREFRQPMIVIGRFRDNCYMLFLNMPPTMKPHAMRILEGFFLSLFGLPMKWEPQPTPTCAEWGESRLSLSPCSISLRRKGVTLELTPGKGEWLRWVVVGSQNARFTLKSMLPSLALKLIWMAANVEDLIMNFRSIFIGLGWHGYPTPWWKPCLTRFLERYDLFQLFSYFQLMQWVRVGKSHRLLCDGLQV